MRGAGSAMVVGQWVGPLPLPLPRPFCGCLEYRHDSWKASLCLVLSPPRAPQSPPRTLFYLSTERKVDGAGLITGFP